MSDERRYNEQEIAAIFRQAAAEQESAQRQLPHGSGLTLTEIEQVGQDAGITPEFIARAAASLGGPLPVSPSKTFLGLPVSITRTVDLPGTFGDEDWNRLLVDLHDLFHVPGEVQHEGSLRQWKNDHIYVMVEPVESGHRLRLGTLNPYPWVILSGAMLSLLMGLFFTLLFAAKGKLVADLAATLFAAIPVLMGLGGIGAAAHQFPRWQQKQEAQMDAIAARAVERARAKAGALPRASGVSPDLNLDTITEEPETLHHEIRHRSRS